MSDETPPRQRSAVSGRKLLYPDGTVQHGGVICGIGGIAGHAHKHYPGSAPGDYQRLQLVQSDGSTDQFRYRDRRFRTETGNRSRSAGIRTIPTAPSSTRA
jgi:hypothetical protein